MRRKFRSILHREPLEEALVNLTPLIDIVFVVLITFILITPVLDIDTVDLAKGGTVEKKELQSSPITITVRSDNSIWHQGIHVSLEELKGLLELEKKRKPNAIPQIFQDEKAQFGTYQSLKNTVEKVGFKEMDLVLKPQ